MRQLEVVSFPAATSVVFLVPLYLLSFRAARTHSDTHVRACVFIFSFSKRFYEEKSGRLAVRPRSKWISQGARESTWITHTRTIRESSSLYTNALHAGRQLFSAIRGIGQVSKAKDSTSERGQRGGRQSRETERKRENGTLGLVRIWKFEHRPRLSLISRSPFPMPRPWPSYTKLLGEKQICILLNASILITSRIK